MESLFPRMQLEVRAAGPEETEALKEKIEISALSDEYKRLLVTELDKKKLAALVDAATADETETLEARIKQSKLLDNEKQDLLTRLDKKKLEALVDAATAAVTKTLKADIEKSMLLGDDKQVLLKRLDRMELKEFGNYFTLIDELFVNDNNYDAAEEVEKEKEEFYESCCRGGYFSPDDRKRRRDDEAVSVRRTMQCRSQNGTNDVYEITYRQAHECDEAATNDGQSNASTHGGNRMTLWPVNVLGEAHTQGAQIAHLVPASVQGASSYWFVADFLFGMDSRRDWHKTTRLIHGSNGPRGDNTGRVNHTGIKHMVTNKILLASQADYLDRTPCVIIVPIMNRNEGPVNARNWSGQAYDAIMLIDSYDVTNNDTEMASPLENVATGTRYTYLDGTKKNTATAAEVKMAMDLFRDYTRAIYFAQVKRKPTKLDFSMEGTGLFYPKLPENYENLNVRKISFASNDSKEGHPSPDPLLLLSKSIAVLQARHGFKIVAAAEPRDNNLPSDESIQAEEEFLRLREQSMIHRDPLGMDILVG